MKTRGRKATTRVIPSREDGEGPPACRLRHAGKGAGRYGLDAIPLRKS